MEGADFRAFLVSSIFILASFTYSFALTQFDPLSPFSNGKYDGDDEVSISNQEQAGSPLFLDLMSPFPRSLRPNKKSIRPQTQSGSSMENSVSTENDVVPLLSELQSASSLKDSRTNKGLNSLADRMASKDDRKSDKKKKLEGLKEISWRECSAKNVQVYLSSNVRLRCEMWAPIGSTVTWSKDDLPLRTQHHGNISFINPFQRNDVIQNNGLENIGRSTYEFHLKTLYNLDCITTDDEGLYKLRISTPRGKVYTRSFNVKTVGTSSRYSILYCKFFNVYSQQFDPRIIEFSKTIIGKIGEELILPCRLKELESIAVNWNKVDRKITPDNYSITDEGDLRIHKLSADDKGFFVCEVFHIVSEITYDQITTFVKVRD